MKWEDNTGPLCTRADALELFDQLMSAWPTTQFRDVAKAIKTFADFVTEEKLPLRYARAAVREIIREGDFFPRNPAGEVITRALLIWPPKDYTREMQERARQDEERRGGVDERGGEAG